MYLKERKLPKWKEKEELFKTQNFDASLAELGKNGAFINSKEIDEKLKSPTQPSEEAKPCSVD